MKKSDPEISTIFSGADRPQGCSRPARGSARAESKAHSASGHNTRIIIAPHPPNSCGLTEMGLSGTDE
jgi:hypothetical protein